jgi:hypothetical protein
MISKEEIRNALHASRVVTLPIANPHGPLGLEQLAEVVEQLRNTSEATQGQVQRPIALSVETWAKLDSMARELGRQQCKRVTASDVLTALVMQGLDAVNK